MNPRWKVFGRWPSTHDLDVVLEADGHTRKSLARWAHSLGDARYHFVPPADVPLPSELIQQATDLAARCKPSPFLAYGRDALPIDAYLIPRRPEKPSLAAWIPPPYTMWRLEWTQTPPGFYDTARELPDPGKIAPAPLR